MTVKNLKCENATCHCRKARPYRADLSLLLNVPVVAVNGNDGRKNISDRVTAVVTVETKRFCHLDRSPPPTSVGVTLATVTMAIALLNIVLPPGECVSVMFVRQQQARACTAT